MAKLYRFMDLFYVYFITLIDSPKTVFRNKWPVRVYYGRNSGRRARGCRGCRGYYMCYIPLRSFGRRLTNAVRAHSKIAASKSSRITRHRCGEISSSSSSSSDYSIGIKRRHPPDSCQNIHEIYISWDPVKYSYPGIGVLNYPTNVFASHVRFTEGYFFSEIYNTIIPISNLFIYTFT